MQNSYFSVPVKTFWFQSRLKFCTDFDPNLVDPISFLKASNFFLICIILRIHIKSTWMIWLFISLSIPVDACIRTRDIQKQFLFPSQNFFWFRSYDSENSLRTLSSWMHTKPIWMILNLYHFKSQFECIQIECFLMVFFR